MSVNINIMPSSVSRRVSSQDVIKKILVGDTYATVMLLIFVDTLGDEKDEDVGLKALHWHPQTIREYMEARWGVELPQQNFDKLMAAITVVTTDLFFTDTDGFIRLCNVLAGDEFNPGQFNPADSVECAWGCTEALLLDPPDHENPEPFGDEIRHYLAHILKEEGFIQPPDILKLAIAADFSAQVNFDFADDPEMFSGIYAVQREKTEEVETILKESLLDLLGQLKVLPLKHGSTHEIASRVASILKSTTEEKPLA